MVLVRHLRKLTCKHFRPPHLLSLLILLFFTLCNMCHKQFFYRHHQSPFVTFKNANKSRGILHTSFFQCFQKKCWHPFDRKPLVWKIPQKHCIPKSSWNGPKYIACADIRSLRVLTVACSKQILSWVSAAAIWYNLIPD